MSTAEKNDFKKLKVEYASQLSMLEELFADWSEEDLLFTLQDANGDLELAIDRISIGQVNQWDEVKTKKSKKEAASVNNNLNKPTISESTIKPKANSIKQRPNINDNRSLVNSFNNKIRLMEESTDKEYTKNMG
ncbi:hypothetical protein G6F22_010434 [Rhizopus arrhizus]|nr:hypothetical protein G6F22_010434 [Rhizopus arrhizus]